MIPRVSAPSSRQPTPVPTGKDISPRPPSSHVELSKDSETKHLEPEIELELEMDSKPVDTLAERRARRQAIRAKYAGVSSTALSTSDSVAVTDTPSPGIRSAISLPPSTSAVADHASQTSPLGTVINVIKEETPTIGM